MATLIEQALEDIVILPGCPAVTNHAPNDTPDDALELAVTHAAGLVLEILPAADGSDKPAVMYTIMHTLRWLMTTGAVKEIGTVARQLIEMWSPQWDILVRKRQQTAFRPGIGERDNSGDVDILFPYRD